MQTIIDTRGARETTSVRVVHIGGEATTSAVQWPGFKGPDPLYDEFIELAEEWHAETGHLSSPRQIAMHPAYQRIIGLGESAIPLILTALKERGGHWYWALRAITNASPVPVAAAGNISRMKEAWLRWGEARGYIDPTA